MKICYVADNTPRENWGCRGTSMALRSLLSEKNDIVSTIYGDYTGHYDPIGYIGFVPRKTIWDKLLKRIKVDTYSKKYYQADFVCRHTDDSLNKFLSIYSKYPPLKELYDKVYNSDAVVMNGEGTFIFTSKPSERYDLKFYLFILALAQKLGKKTYLLNAMFSDSPVSERNDFLLEEARAILQRCDYVSARDPLSFDYCKRFLLDSCDYIPDALFTWTKYLAQYRDAIVKMPLLGMTFPEYPAKWLAYTPPVNSHYIVVSGSSLASYYLDSVADHYVQLVNELKKKYTVILAPACAGDRWLEDVARKTQTMCISSQTNMLYVMSLLANASVYVSGRWHPSILASIGGTPCVFVNSNSHKTFALQVMLDYEEPREYDVLNLSDRTIECIVKDVDNLLILGEDIREKIRKNALTLSEECKLKTLEKIL